MDVSNMHIRFVCDKLARFAYEGTKAQSSAANFFSEADSARLASYLDSIDSAHAWIKGTPMLDLPKSTPSILTLEEFPAAVDADNEAVNMIQDILRGCWTELASGQSSRLGSSFIEHDSKRLSDGVEHCRNFLTAYIATVQPLDQPESTPMEPSTGQGNNAA